MQRLREENEILKEQLVSVVNLESPGVKKVRGSRSPMDLC